jgi:membrane-bound lytic murein transglycosylase D
MTDEEERRRLEKERAERRRRITALLEDARLALKDRRIDDATRNLVLGREIDATVPELSELAERILQAQEAAPAKPAVRAVPSLSVRTEDGRVLRFSQPFQIGRDRDCGVRIENVQVSRHHARVAFEDGRWRLRDLKSGNGIFVDGRRVESASIDSRLTIHLGADGPRVVMDVETRALPKPPPPIPAPSASETVLLSSYAERYFGAKGSTPNEDEESVGGRTLMIRKAFHRVQRKQRRIYGAILAIAALVALIAAAYAYYGHRQLRQQEALAQDLFYSMKLQDVAIANVERGLLASGKPQDQDQVQRYLARRREMENSYDRYVSGLKLYDHPLTAQEQLILRVTRLFGECELAAPPEYLAEVASYIRKWQSTGSFAAAVNRARDKGYAKKIAAEFERQDLPAQFFYLAMQESGFNEAAVGPPTRMGFAKGMWMFIPETGRRYGLTIGPLAGIPKPDVADDRHNWEKETRAAASYIKDIYATDAQASGLLVMASYNWGEGRVIKLLRTMPANPRERNFWKLLQRYREQVPPETYNYVLSIVSAAVIGENPKLFGFGVDSPLAFDRSPG